MGLFGFGKRKELPYKRGDAAHEIRKDVLHWKEGDSLVVKRGSVHGRPISNKVPTADFYLFVGFPSPTKIAVIQASPRPSGHFTEKHGARVETKDCYDFLPHVRNYSYSARKADKREKQVVEATESSSYMRFLKQFQKEYQKETERDRR